tara:strand:- start:131 stop:286 length:156 start_codon:yes stop_codon:yes gene_type:complete
MDEIPSIVVKNDGMQGKFMTRRRMITHYARSKDRQPPNRIQNEDRRAEDAL